MSKSNPIDLTCDEECPSTQVADYSITDYDPVHDTPMYDFFQQLADEAKARNKSKTKPKESPSEIKYIETEAMPIIHADISPEEDIPEEGEDLEESKEEDDADIETGEEYPDKYLKNSPYPDPWDMYIETFGYFSDYPSNQ